MPRLLEQYVPDLPNLKEMFPVTAELISQRESATEFPDVSCARPHDHAEAVALGAALWEASADLTAVR